MSSRNSTNETTCLQLRSIGPEAEPMAGFFDRRADGYEAHMREDPDFDRFYAEATVPIAETAEPISVLDLGCGTGLELKGLFERAPNARVTCVDLSSGMLEKLRENHRDRLGQLAIVQASYVDWQYPAAAYDYALSVNTMHHFLEPTKAGIYRQILSALKPGGAYIEADYMVDGDTMARHLAEYHRIMAAGGAAADGTFHLDIPFTPEVQRRLLLEAGFAEVRTLLERIQPERSRAVLVAHSLRPCSLDVGRWRQGESQHRNPGQENCTTKMVFSSHQEVTECASRRTRCSGCRTSSRAIWMSR